MKKLLGAILAFLLLSTSAFAVVSSTNSKDIFSGDGSTVAWQYDFPIILTSDIQIFTIDSSGNVTPITTNYSINTSTSIVTYPVSGTPLPVGSQIILQRVEPLTQATSLKNQYRLPLDVIETSLDKLTLITQQLQTSLNQTIQQAVNSTTPIMLPGYVAGDLLAWGNTPGSIVNVANPAAVAQWTATGVNISYNAGNVSTTQNFTVGGNIGIGTLIPAYPLDVNGTARVTALTQTGTNPDTFSGTVTLNNSPNALIVPNGNIGIGTATPGQKLDVNGTIRAIAFSGSGAALTGIASVPSGAILMWHGSIATIPSGYHLCDGTNGTPDLRARFIVGAGGDSSTYSPGTDGIGTGVYAPGDTGGHDLHALTTGELPNFSLTFVAYINGVNGFSGEGTTAPRDSPTTGTTSSIGSNIPFEDRPPFYALAYIMKL